MHLRYVFLEFAIGFYIFLWSISVIDIRKCKDWENWAFYTIIVFIVHFFAFLVGCVAVMKIYVVPFIQTNW